MQELAEQFYKIMSIYSIGDIPEESEPNCEYSDNVLIDIDGDRTLFFVGWYDHEVNEWKLHVDEDVAKIEPSMRWTWLNLIKYERKPPRLINA